MYDWSDGPSMADDNFAAALLRHVCDQDRLLTGVLALVMLLFLLMLVSLTVVEPGTGTYVIVVLNLVGLVLFGILYGAVLLACRSWEETRSWE